MQAENTDSAGLTRFPIRPATFTRSAGPPGDQNGYTDTRIHTYINTLEELWLANLYLAAPSYLAERRLKIITDSARLTQSRSGLLRLRVARCHPGTDKGTRTPDTYIRTDRGLHLYDYEARFARNKYIYTSEC